MKSDGSRVLQEEALLETILEGRNNQRGMYLNTHTTMRDRLLRMDNTGLLNTKGRNIFKDQSEDGRSNSKSQKGSWRTKPCF